MRYLNGCTECHTVWWGCRCPLRCEECGCGYRGDGNGTCGTPGCRAGERRAWAIMARADDERRAPEAPVIQCAAATDSEVAETLAMPAGNMPSPSRGGVQNGQRRKPEAKPAARAGDPPEDPAHRPVAERRAAVEALLNDGMSDRAIARAVKVSPSTVAAVRRDRAVAPSSI